VMFYKNIFKNRVLIAIAITLLNVLAIGVSVGMAQEPEHAVVVIYPKPDQVIGAVDSTFIFGNVPPTQGDWSYSLAINCHIVPVHPDGGFLAFLPITPGEFEFSLHAHLQHKKGHDYSRYIKKWRKKHGPQLPEILSSTLTVLVPEPIEPLTHDRLVIDTSYDRNKITTDLSTGDRLQVQFRGTPGCTAWFSIAGIVDSVPMAESDPRTQAYWGEAVFGAGAVPDSLMIHGVYYGFWDVPDWARVDTARVQYHLAPRPRSDIFQSLFSKPDSIGVRNISALIKHSLLNPIHAVSAGRFTLNDPIYPVTVRFTDTVQIVRHGPRKGYFSIFQPEGVEAVAVGAIGDWYKVRFSLTQYGYVNKKSVDVLPKGILPQQSYLRSIRTYNSEKHVQVEFPLKAKHPFRIIEEDRRTIHIQLFGVTTDTDWIRYDFSDSLIDLAIWSQPEAGLYQLTLQLTADIWGYDTYYDGSNFYFQLNKPPAELHTLRGKIIVVDPGHSGDPGAIGPTGYTEAEANLGISLELRRQLQNKGAIVIMTRIDSSHVPLYDRPAIAKQHDADLFVSIHNNALPDGVNPFEHNGSSCYYYHPHSINLARNIHRELLKATGLMDHGLFHGNLAVNRPTQYPAVLIECAFQIIPEQEARIKTDKFRKRVAKAICRGIEDFLKGYDNGR